MADLREAKRRTLVEFNRKLIALPMEWKSKRLDVLVPAQGLYVETGMDPARFLANVRREADDQIVYPLPALSKNGDVVLISEEDFAPADEAWGYLGGEGAFPGRGGMIILVIAAISKLLGASTGPMIAATPAVYAKKPTWPYWLAGLTLGLGFITAVGAMATRDK